LFLGFALDKQAKFSEAEQAYLRATKAKPNDAQAWQGLIKLYEKQGSKKVDEYQLAALRLAEIYRDADDKYKCQDVVDKFIVFAKNQGTRQQHRKSLEILLPTSSIYDYLEGRIPHPSHTYQTIAQITEAEEKERLNKEIGERRTRLGAKINQVTLDVRREIFRDSPLEDVYSKVIDWSTDDDIRRQFEEKLLQRCYDILTVAAPEQKKETCAKVQKLASDMVIIKHPFKLAWDITIEWQDCKAIEDWDAGVLREYCLFFPQSGLAKVLEGYMTSEVSLIPAAPKTQDTIESDDSEDDDEGGGVHLDAPISAEDRLLLMTEGMSEASTSILAHRAMGEYYAFLDEHEPIVELMRAGLKLVRTESLTTGLSFENSSQILSAMLGTALVFHQSPKNHPEAKSIFEGILNRNPTSTPALIGIGLIYEEEEDFPSAINFLERALQRDPRNIRVRAEAAWVKALNGDYESSREELESCLAIIDGSDPRSRELRAETQYRIGVCIWNIDTSKAARKDRSGAYSKFLAALKSNLNFAPAYTSLGIYYSDYANDKKRARKCFQKAFEVSASEVEAAKRLARVFADQGEWELVEVVAQRVVDSGKVKPSPGSKKKGISWPFAALGVAELNKQDYAKSIASFQQALRTSPNDYHSWVGLGESYHNSGRYIAATKAFTHAEKFEQEIEQQNSGDTWFAKYMLANVKRELGEFGDAIARYRDVLSIRPEEFGVEVALVQTLVESAWDSIDKGLFGQATQVAREAIETSESLIGRRPDAFNIWKSLGDACSIFSYAQGRMKEFPHDIMKRIFQGISNKEGFDLLSDVDKVGMDIVLAVGLFPSNEKDAVNLTRCLQGAILSHKQAIEAASNDIHAQAVAHYNLGWAEHRAHICLRSHGDKSTTYLKASIRCFKRAIELEAGNSEFWNALGVVTSELSPKVAQHSFVRSLFLNERSSQAWTNLGSLYLLQGDSQLANEAFTRAQSSDPEYAHAWVGQGILALLFGDEKEAKLLFTHAQEISDSSSTFTKRQYATSTFDYLVQTTSETNITDLVQPIFALNQLHSMSPKDLPYRHLSSLFSERAHDTATSASLLTVICSKLEADYKQAKSIDSLSRLALAESDLARSQLADGLYREAIANGEKALQLTSDETTAKLSAEQRLKARLSSHLTVGLALYHSSGAVSAIPYIESALSENPTNPDAICLFVQILWATNDESHQERARDLLFECVEANPAHVQCVLLLGTIALIDADLESLEAVVADLQTFRTEREITDAEQGMIGELLRAAAAMSEEDPDKEVRNEVQAEVFMFPGQPAGWSRLADVEAVTEEGSGRQNAKEMALLTALKAVPPNGKLDAGDLVVPLAGTGRPRDAQRGVVMAPWLEKGWVGLRESVVS
jgi:superkiller protein 3